MIVARVRIFALPSTLPAMRRFYHCLIRAVLLLYFSAACATPPIRVEAIQAQAWLGVASERVPLQVGDVLQSGDRIYSDKTARVYLRLADGSRVKLGANAELGIVTATSPRAERFEGALEVVRGAFRYTTGVVAKTKGERDLKIRVATSVIGIRGTDVWGRASPGGELVALIEGRISLERGAESYTLQPMQYLDAPTGVIPTVRELDVETLARLAAETEIEGFVAKD